MLDKTNTTSLSKAAYSLRQLSSTYTHAAITPPASVSGSTNSATPVVRVRRDSDNGMLDIGYTANGDLDTAALKAFAGTANVYAAIWYDQGGNNNDAVQNTTANQPRLVLNGVVDRQAGLPALVYSGSQWLNTPLSLDRTALPAVTVNMVYRAATLTTGSSAIWGSDNGNFDRFQLLSFDQIPAYTLGTGTGATAASLQNGLNTLGQVIYSAVLQTGIPGGSVVYANGTAGTAFTESAGDAAGTLQIGNIGNGQYPARMQAQEFICFGTALTATERQALEANQGAYYYAAPAAITALDKTGGSSPSSGAYSLRQLKAAYSHAAIVPPAAAAGPANSAAPVVRVRRDLDNALLDIGYTANGDLDTAALKAFAGTGSAYAAIWYDQSGNNNDAVQLNTVLQPQLVAAGSVNRSGAMPALLYSGNQWLATPLSLDRSAVPAATVNMVYQATAVSSGNAAIWGSDNGNYDRFQLLGFGQYPSYSFGSSTGLTAANPQSGLNTLAGVVYTSVMQNGVANGSAVYVNGTPGSAYTEAPGDGAGLLQIGNIGSGLYPARMYNQEFLCFFSALAPAERQALEANQSGYYYPSGPQMTAAAAPLQASDIAGTRMGLAAAGSNTAAAASGIRVYPNPVTGASISLAFTGMAAGEYRLTLTDPFGSTVYRRTLGYDGLAPSVSIPSGGKAGVYILSIASGSYRHTIKVIVQ